jgi:hypothetical protein
MTIENLIYQQYGELYKESAFKSQF